MTASEGLNGVCLVRPSLMVERPVTLSVGAAVQTHRKYLGTAVEAAALRTKHLGVPWRDVCSAYNWHTSFSAS